jgi:hypothetical protein
MDSFVQAVFHAPQLFNSNTIRYTTHSGENIEYGLYSFFSRLNEARNGRTKFFALPLKIY